MVHSVLDCFATTCDWFPRGGNIDVINFFDLCKMVCDQFLRLLFSVSFPLDDPVLLLPMSCMNETQPSFIVSCCTSSNQLLLLLLSPVLVHSPPPPPPLVFASPPISSSNTVNMMANFGITKLRRMFTTSGTLPRNVRP